MPVHRSSPMPLYIGYAGWGDFAGHFQRILAGSQAFDFDFPAVYVNDYWRRPTEDIECDGNEPSRKGAEGEGVVRPMFKPKVLPEIAAGILGDYSNVIGIASEWTANFVDKVATATFHAECMWAAHLGLHTLLLPPPRVELQDRDTGRLCDNLVAMYARELLDVVSETKSPAAGVQLMVRIPLVIYVDTENGSSSTDGNYEMNSSRTGGSVVRVDGWAIWQRLYKAMDHPANLEVCLELTFDLPEPDCFGNAHPVNDLTNLENEDYQEATNKRLNRWVCEPVKAVLIPADAFQINQKGFPVLPRRLKDFMLLLMEKKRISIVLSSDLPLLPEHLPQCSADEKTFRDKHKRRKNNNHSPDDEERSSGESCEMTPFKIVQRQSYLGNLFQSLPALTEQEAFMFAYWDVLQIPLQPLKHNLENAAYATFEADPVKYQQYELAVVACLWDRILAGKTHHSIVVAGAGRGPLVERTLRAIEANGLAADETAWTVVALEKNVNAVFTLEDRVSRDPNPLWRRVIVTTDDMRYWNPPQPVDVVVTELLGSFGDNELSPECLDAVEKYLTSDGVVIPKAYTSHLEPVMSTVLWSHANQIGGNGKQMIGEPLEASYVVKAVSAQPISTSGAQPLFQFVHPRDTADPSNRRSGSRQFAVSVPSVCHGFMGYFDSVLYGDITLSTVPATHTQNMTSWFSIYFPIKEPQKVIPGDLFDIHVWRMTDATRVWYEWCFSGAVTSAIHNASGPHHVGKY